MARTRFVSLMEVERRAAVGGESPLEQERSPWLAVLGAPGP